MSVVATAIIVGATAGLTNVAGAAVSDLYKGLKALVLQTSKDFDFANIEKDPKNQAARDRLSEQVEVANLDASEKLRKTAERLIKEILAENIPLDNGALISIRKLKAGGDIIFEDIELSRRLMEADVVETAGEFRLHGFREISKKGEQATSAFQIGQLNAGVANLAVSTFYSIPKAIRITIILIFTALLLILVWGVIARLASDATKRQNFDASFEDSMRSSSGNEYRSSVNYVLSTIPNAIRHTRDTDHWKRFSYSWNKHIGRIESFYADLFEGISDGTMLPGESADTVCGQIGSILESHFSIRRRIADIAGIGIDQTGGNASLLTALGPVVQVPETTKMQFLYTRACDGDLNALANPPDTRSKEEQIADKIASIDASIAELESLKNLDIDTEFEKSMLAFVKTYASFLVNNGMLQADAVQEAKTELGTFLDSLSRGAGGGFNYQVPGMNDIVDRLLYLDNLLDRDLDAEIEKLRTQRDKLAQQL